MMRPLLPRRPLLGLAGVALTMPWIGQARAEAGEVLVRNPGGAYDDAMRRHVYEPFTKETGIRVTTVAATAARLLAMFRANNVELDIIDSSDNVLEQLRRIDALAPIEYGAWAKSKPDDITAELRLPTRCANLVYAATIAYRRDAFPSGAPKNWTEFWDVSKFPGGRTLADMATGNAHLEFALLADGVPKDKLYPLDLNRAFRSLDRLRPSIRKFWDTGALSAQMLSDGEVAAGGLWNGRVEVLIDRGAPLGLEWNGNMIEVQAVGIFKGARNGGNAQKLIDYMMQPSVQAAYCQELTYGPTNARAYDAMPAEQQARLPGSPKLRELGFYKNIVWWEDNREAVNRRWSRWILG